MSHKISPFVCQNVNVIFKIMTIYHISCKVLLLYQSNQYIAYIVYMKPVFHTKLTHATAAGGVLGRELRGM